jgi:hypothetical protein
VTALAVADWVATAVPGMLLDGGDGFTCPWLGWTAEELPAAGADTAVAVDSAVDAGALMVAAAG